MPKGPQGEKRKKTIVCTPKSKEIPRTLPDGPAVRIPRIATLQEIGDTADEITRAPKKKR
jgi:hypothetical protein